MKFNEIAKNIIKENIYLSLATTDEDAVWISPVFYVTDKNNSFYFVSHNSSKHVKNIKRNKYIACSIFNSTLKPEQVNGVQFDGLCRELKITEIPSAIKLIYSNKDAEIMKERFLNYMNPQSYSKLTGFRIFRIKPLHFYVLDPNITDNDIRVEIKV